MWQRRRLAVEPCETEDQPLMSERAQRRCIPQCVRDDLPWNRGAVLGILHSLKPLLRTRSALADPEKKNKPHPRTLTSASPYPNLSTTNATLGPARASRDANARTCVESPARNARTAAGAARVGCAAMSQDGHGVGTCPICRPVTGPADQWCAHTDSFRHGSRSGTPPRLQTASS